VKKSIFGRQKEAFEKGRLGFCVSNSMEIQARLFFLPTLF
jgi:hypothetical protein